MKVVTVRDFRDRASEMFRSEDVILVTRDGAPAGFYLHWDNPEVPVDVRREVFLRLSEQIGRTTRRAGRQRARGPRGFRCQPPSSLTPTSSSQRSSAAAHGSSSPPHTRRAASPPKPSRWRSPAQCWQ
jgi:hypothetical protein